MRRPKLELLTKEDVRRIIEAAYDLLGTFGVMVDNQEVLQTLADGGARVDLKEKVAFIPPSMVDKALQSAPSAFGIYDQACHEPAVLEGDNVHFCAGSVALNILDSVTQAIRKPNLADLIRITSLIETLEHVHFVTGCLMPHDIPAPLQDAYRYYLLMLNTSKPLFSGAFTIDGLRVQIEILKVLQGGDQELRARPRAIFAANPTAPLRWGGIVAQNLVDAARAGVPAMLIGGDQEDVRPSRFTHGPVRSGLCVWTPLAMSLVCGCTYRRWSKYLSSNVVSRPAAAEAQAASRTAT